MGEIEEKVKVVLGINADQAGVPDATEDLD
jgi:hypothetical protein